MPASDRDPALHTLLNLDGQVFYMGDKGHRVQFVVAKVTPSRERPHGLTYTLTVHDPRGDRIAGFDNAHGVPASQGPGANVWHLTTSTASRRCALMTTWMQRRCWKTFGTWRQPCCKKKV